MDVIIGVDGHKQSHTLVAIDEVGRPIKELTIGNDRPGFIKAYRWAGRVGQGRLWGIENSGHFRSFAQYLVAQQERVLEVSPHLTGRKRRRSRDAAKSDPHDALAVARVALQEADHLPVVQADDETTQVSILVEQRDNLVNEQRRLLNQMHSQLTEIDPHYKKRLGMLQSQRALRYCRSFPSPKRDPIRATRVAIVRQLAGLIGSLREQIQQLEGQLTPLVERLAPSLLSIQGIGILRAGQLIARIRHIEWTASSASLAHHAGLAPLRAGTAGNYYHRVNPKGDRRLNSIFHMIAQVQSRYNPLAQAYLVKKKAEGKTSKHAFRCLKRRMVDIVYAVWRSGSPYRVPTARECVAA